MATAADFQALAARIGPEQVAISSVVASCTALEGGQLVDWYALAKRCVQYVSIPSLAESGAGSWSELIARGNDLWDELQTWRATLEALGCAPPHLREKPAPYSPGKPASGWSDLWGLGSILPLILVAVAWSEWKGSRR